MKWLKMCLDKLLCVAIRRKVAADRSVCPNNPAEGALQIPQTANSISPWNAAALVISCWSQYTPNPDLRAGRGSVTEKLLGI
jgi:hypothetical protein